MGQFSENSIPLLVTVKITPLMGTVFCKTIPLLGTVFYKKHTLNGVSFVKKGNHIRRSIHVPPYIVCDPPWVVDFTYIPK